MRRLNGTTVSAGTGILGVAGAGFLAAWAELDRPVWAIMGWTCIGLAAALFFFGWVLPGFIGDRSNEGSGAGAEVRVDPSPNANSRGNTARDDQQEVGIEVPPDTPVRVPKGVPPNTTVRITTSEDLDGDEREEGEADAS